MFVVAKEEMMDNPLGTNHRSICIIREIGWATQPDRTTWIYRVHACAVWCLYQSLVRYCFCLANNWFNSENRCILGWEGGLVSQTFTTLYGATSQKTVIFLHQSEKCNYRNCCHVYSHFNPKQIIVYEQKLCINFWLKELLSGASFSQKMKASLFDSIIYYIVRSLEIQFRSKSNTS